jgi:hypothetical protein
MLTPEIKVTQVQQVLLVCRAQQVVVQQVLQVRLVLQDKLVQQVLLEQVLQVQQVLLARLDRKVLQVSEQLVYKAQLVLEVLLV